MKAFQDGGLPHTINSVALIKLAMACFPKVKLFLQSVEYSLEQTK